MLLSNVARNLTAHAVKPMQREKNQLSTSLRTKHTQFLPPATKLGQGNIFRSMCQEFCPRGGGAGVSAHCRGRHPPIAVHAGRYGQPAVRILLECILVISVFCRS